MVLIQAPSYFSLINCNLFHKSEVELLFMFFFFFGFFILLNRFYVAHFLQLIYVQNEWC